MSDALKHFFNVPKAIVRLAVKTVSQYKEANVSGVVADSVCKAVSDYQL